MDESRSFGARSTRSRLRPAGWRRQAWGTSVELHRVLCTHARICLFSGGDACRSWLEGHLSPSCLVHPRAHLLILWWRCVSQLAGGPSQHKHDSFGTVLPRSLEARCAEAAGQAHTHKRCCCSCSTLPCGCHWWRRWKTNAKGVDVTSPTKLKTWIAPGTAAVFALVHPTCRRSVASPFDDGN